MKKYKKYMDGVRVSDTLHQRLLQLEASGKRPIPWKKYGTVAAALALTVGLGAWGLGKAGGWGSLWAKFQPAGVPEIIEEVAAEPDIAIEDPSEIAEPGEKTLGGYDVTIGSGAEAVVAHYVLPYIEYGEVDGAAMSLDWDIPKGASRRDLSRDEIIALMGGEDAVNTHLDWGDYELTGWGAWYEDGSFWGAYIDGILPYYGGPANQFEFAVTAGQLPPTCFGYPSSVTQEIRGITVTADKSDWEEQVFSFPTYVHQRRLSFMEGGYGYRFEMSCGGSGEAAEELASRLVCRIADEGLALTYTCPYCGGTFPFGSVHNDPIITADMVYTCSICGQTFPVGTVHNDPDLGAGEDGSNSTEPYDPREALDPSYNVPTSPDDITCSGYPVPAGPGETHTCPICGAVLPVDVEHAHEICGLPLVPTDTAADSICD